MSVSKHLLILPLGLLITVTGCSSNRLRQIFAPDREFMALNELDQDNGARGKKRERSEQSSESLASQSKDIDDQTNDEKDERLFSVSRWLNLSNTDSIPPDPFLKIDQFDQPANDKNDDPVVVVGHSNELERGEAEELIIEDGKPKQSLAQETADAASADDRRRIPTFADVLAEFEDADENSDDLDALAEEWLAEEIAEDRVSDFDVLMSAATEDSAAANEADGDDPTLNFDVMDEQLFLEDPEEPDLKLAEADESLEGFEERLENHQYSSSRDPFGDEQDQSPATDHVFNNDVSIDESLWESSDSIVGWKNTEPKNDKPGQEQVATAAPRRQKNLDVNEPTEASASGMQRQITMPTVGAAAAPRRQTRRPARDPATALEKTPFRVAAAEIDSQISSEDPFLSDFETETPAVTSPAVVANTGVISNVSPRTWLMLLGGVVIAYLLFAPERKNLRQPNNR